MTRYMTRRDRNRIVAANGEGQTRCTCGAAIIRARTSGNELVKTWTVTDDGTWWLHPVTGIAHPLDPDDEGDFPRLRPHSCILACNPDEADQ
jgi:hypothetical protein